VHFHVFVCITELEDSVQSAIVHAMHRAQLKTGRIIGLKELCLVLKTYADFSGNPS
jgi:hypothetical protein